MASTAADIQIPITGIEHAVSGSERAPRRDDVPARSFRRFEEHFNSAQRTLYWLVGHLAGSAKRLN